MGLKEVLSKMKIVELEPEPGLGMPAALPGEDATSGGLPAAAPSSLGRPSAGRPSGQPTDIRELLGTLPPPPQIDEKDLPEPEPGAEGEIPDFEAVYKAAGIAAPPHGYTCHKVLEILQSPELANLDSRAKAAALAGFLKMNPAGPVPIGDVIQDAVRRDQALDRFEEFLRGKLRSRAEETERENARLQAEIDELVQRNREKMDTNRRILETEEAKLAQWQVSKRIEERRLFDAVSPFVESNPITTGAGGSSAPAPSSQPSPSPRPSPTPEGQG